ncbi:MAG: hypothetical protein K9L85_03005 [Candidatus Peribacteraceae bacterium]|nr:hypothetical protein [Candidatus Peribacteraceae bacterium]
MEIQNQIRARNPEMQEDSKPAPEKQKNPQDIAREAETKLLPKAHLKIEAAPISISRKSRLKKETKEFIFKAAFSDNKGSLDRFNAGEFDIDGKEGLSEFEFKKFTDALNKAIGEIIALKDFNDFIDVQKDIEDDINRFSAKKQLEGLTGGGRSASDWLSDKVGELGDLAPEDREKLLNVKWNAGAGEFMKGVAYSLAHEAPQMVEDTLLLLADLPMAIGTIPQYLYYRFRAGSVDTKNIKGSSRSPVGGVVNIEMNTTNAENPEYAMKLQAMTEAHPLIGLLHMLSSEQGIDAAKHIIDGIGSPSEWTAQSVVQAITSLLGMIAGGAGVARMGARAAGMVTRKGSRLANMANKMEKVAGKTQSALQRADNLVNMPGNLVMEGAMKGAGRIVRERSTTNLPDQRVTDVRMAVNSDVTPSNYRAGPREPDVMEIAGPKAKNSDNTSSAKVDLNKWHEETQTAIGNSIKNAQEMAEAVDLQAFSHALEEAYGQIELLKGSNVDVTLLKRNLNKAATEGYQKIIDARLDQARDFAKQNDWIGVDQALADVNRSLNASAHMRLPIEIAELRKQVEGISSQRILTELGLDDSLASKPVKKPTEVLEPRNKRVHETKPQLTREECLAQIDKRIGHVSLEQMNAFVSDIKNELGRILPDAGVDGRKQLSIVKDGTSMEITRIDYSNGEIGWVINSDATGNNRYRLSFSTDSSGKITSYTDLTFSRRDLGLSNGNDSMEGLFSKYNDADISMERRRIVAHDTLVDVKGSLAKIENGKPMTGSELSQKLQKESQARRILQEEQAEVARTARREALIHSDARYQQLIKDLEESSRQRHVTLIEDIQASLGRLSEKFKNREEFGSRGRIACEAGAKNLTKYAERSEEHAKIVKKFLSESHVELSDVSLEGWANKLLDTDLLEDFNTPPGISKPQETFLKFQNYYNPERMDDFINGRASSPYLKKLSPEQRYMVVEGDLIRIAVQSGDNSFREYLTSLQRVKENFPNTGVVSVKSLTPAEAAKFQKYVEQLEGVYLTSPLAKKSPLLPNRTEMDLGDRYENMLTLLRVPRGQHPVDRIAEMLLKPAGYDNVSSAIKAMDVARQTAHARNVDFANQLIGKGKRLQLHEGDLVRGDKNWSSNLDQGFKSGEYYSGRSSLGDDAADKTPFGLDFARASKVHDMVDVPLSEAIKNSAASPYGPVYIVVRNRGQLNFTEDVGYASKYSPNSNQYEVYGIGTRGRDHGHADLRTGVPSTEIDAIVAGENIEDIMQKVVDRGVYIPVVDRDGKIILTPQKFADMVRAKNAKG